MIRCALIATVVNCVLVDLLASAGLFDLPLYHRAILAGQGVLCIFLYFGVGKRAERLEITTWLYIATMLTSQLSTDLLHTTDVMRLTWSFAYVAACVAVGGPRIGVAVLGASIASLVFANTTREVLPAESLISICASLTVTFVAMAVAVQYVFKTLDALQESRDAQTRLAHTDVVTGLANRLAFDSRFKQLVATNDRFWLVLADLDNFKYVNDTYGHDAGDLILNRTARLFSEAVREHDFAARIGGEEFGLLFGACDGDHVFHRVEEMRKRIEDQKVDYMGHTIQITASFGIVDSDAPRSASARLYSRADRALYAAKNEGRNRSCLANTEPELDKVMAVA